MRRLHSAHTAAAVAGGAGHVSSHLSPFGHHHQSRRTASLGTSGGGGAALSPRALGGRRSGELPSRWHSRSKAGSTPAGGSASDEYRIVVVADAAGGPGSKGERALAGWPVTGDLVFYRLSLRYFPGAPLALRSVSFHIRDREKVGRHYRYICGPAPPFTTWY